MNKKAETKRTTKKAKIVKATKERGANEFGQVSKVPPPHKSVNTTSTWTLPQRKKADFKKWLRHDLWRIEWAIMLLLGLEPFDVNADYWDSPPEYDDLYKLAIGSHSVGTLKFHSATQVQPSVFVKWAISKGLDVPEELSELAKNPDAATDAEIKTRVDWRLAFIKECIRKEISPDIESIWQYIRENVGMDGFLFVRASQSTATTVDDKKAEKGKLGRQLRNFLKK